MQKNHNEFDHQTIVIKKEKVDEMISNYECFGWKVISKNQHSMYENLLVVEFFVNISSKMLIQK